MGQIDNDKSFYYLVANPLQSLITWSLDRHQHAGLGSVRPRLQCLQFQLGFLGQGTAHDRKHTTSSVVMRGDGRVIVWTHMAANGTASLLFTHEVFEVISSAHIQQNSSELTWQRFTVQMDDDLMHTAKATNYFFRRSACYAMVKSITLTWIWLSLSCTCWRQSWRENTSRTSRNWRQAAAAASSLSCEHHRGDTQRLMMSVLSWLQAGCKGFATQN